VRNATATAPPLKTRFIHIVCWEKIFFSSNNVPMAIKDSLLKYNNYKDKVYNTTMELHLHTKFLYIANFIIT